jgi:hypothetical protein
MIEIPADIMDAAQRLVGPPTAISEAGCATMARMIAKALLAERERGAKICDDICEDAPSGSYDNGGTMDGWRMACTAIAKAIRGEK